MSAAWPGIPAILLYMAGSWLLARDIRAHRAMAGATLKWIAAAALLLHVGCVYLAMATPAGIDFSFFVVASLVAAALVAAILAVSLVRPLHNLYLLVAPVAAIAVAGSLLFAGTAGPRERLEPGLIAHVLVSVAAYAVLSLGALQSLLLLLLERRLRRHEAIGAANELPPLVTMEGALFVLLWVGIGLLTAAIATGVLFLEDIFAPHLLPHTVLALAAWLVYAALLGGHLLAGWRGETVTRWTLVAFACLALAYFGGKFVLEFLA